MQEDAPNVLFELLHSQLVSHIYTEEEDMKSKQLSLLEAHGYRVGQSLVEQLSKDIPRFKDELEVMKFICRDFWSALYQKQVDNLRTNHQGVYVLQDNNYKLLRRISEGKQYLEYAPRFLAVPCGFVRGALASLGVNSIVTAEVITMPAVKFQIMIQRS